MAKAMRRKAAMFSSPPLGTSATQKSFLSFSNSKLSSSLGVVGICLGRNEREIVMSANALKHVEHDRLTVTPSVSSRRVATPIDDDSANATHR